MPRRYKTILKNGVQCQEHRVIWEKANGPIPKGCEIHHCNGDGRDNRLENLQLLTVKEHRRLHARLRKMGQDPVDSANPRVESSRESNRRYYQRNLEECKEKNRKYYIEHKEERDAYKRAWNAENKDKVSASGKRSYLRHKDTITARHRAYKAAHHEELLAYAKKYNDEHRADHMAYNATHSAQKHTYNISYYESHKELIKIQNRLYRAIKSGKPECIINELRNKLEVLRKEQTDVPA